MKGDVIFFKRSHFPPFWHTICLRLVSEASREQDVH